MHIVSEYESSTVRVQHMRSLHPYEDDFSMHAHNTNEILFFLNGDATYMVEGKEYKLVSGCIMLMMHGEAHMLKLKSDTLYERIVINFTDDFLHDPALCEGLLEPFLKKPLGSDNYFEPDKAFRIYAGACADACGSETLTDLNIKANLTALLQHLRKKYLTKDSTVSGSNSNIRNVIEYINENLYSDMSLDGICKRFFVNKSRLNRDFKEYTGSTVWDYIIIKRLLKAQEMIRSGVKTNIAAESVGFHDYSNFYRSYKSHFKVSPKDDGKN